MSEEEKTHKLKKEHSWWKMIYRYFLKKYYLNILKKSRRCTNCNPKYDINIYGACFPCEECISKLSDKYKHF